MSYSRTLQERRSDFRILEAPVRLEDAKFLCGAGQYIADLVLPGEVHGVFVRSTHGHARLRLVDVTSAQAAPGVLRVLTGADVVAAGLGGVPWEVRPPGARFENMPMGSARGTTPQPLMAHDRVRYVGEIVALVVALTRWQAQDAAELVRVEYDVEPVLATIEAAMANAPAIWHPLSKP